MLCLLLDEMMGSNPLAVTLFINIRKMNMTEKPSREQFYSKREKARRKHEQENRQKREQRRKDFADFVNKQPKWSDYEG